MNITQFFDFVNKVSSLLQLPGELVGILAVPSAILAYLTGRRRSLFEDSATAANETLIAEIRQGFQTMAAAIAALPAEQTRASAAPFPPSGVPAQQSGQVAAAAAAPAAPAPSAPSAQPATATTTFILPDLTLVRPAPRPRVRYPALAICSGLGLVMTLCWVGSYIIYGQYTNQSQTALLADPNYGFFNTIAFLGLFVTLLVLLWACIKAIRIRQPRWALGLFLGTLALTVFTLFTMPGLLVLIFAIRGPGRPSVPPTTQPAAPAPGSVREPVAVGAEHR